MFFVFIAKKPLITYPLNSCMIRRFAKKALTAGLVAVMASPTLGILPVHTQPRSQETTGPLIESLADTTHVQARTKSFSYTRIVPNTGPLGRIASSRGYTVSLDARARERHNNYFSRTNFSELSPSSAVLYIAANPDHCTSPQDGRGDICGHPDDHPLTAQKLSRYLQQGNIGGGVTYTVTDAQKVQQYLEVMLRASDQQRPQTNEQTIHQQTQQDTVYLPSPPDTVRVLARPDTVYVDRPLPEGVLLMERQGRRYTFPNASVVCYAGPPRECVNIPGAPQ